MAYKSNVPHTTPRNTAVERNDASNFNEGPAYDVLGGHPVTKDMPSQEYKATPMKEARESEPKHQPSPFTIKGA